MGCGHPVRQLCVRSAVRSKPQGREKLIWLRAVTLCFHRSGFRGLIDPRVQPADVHLSRWVCRSLPAYGRPRLYPMVLSTDCESRAVLQS
jgi:hypothetical protein